MKAIIKRYQLTVNEQGEQGLFAWRRRMGIHLAFHRDPINIIIHGLFSVVNAWAILLISYPISFFGLTLLGLPIDMAMVILLLVFVLYACLEWGAALFTTLLFATSYVLCEPVFTLLDHSAVAMLVVGVLLTVLALAIQVYIGHGIFERGIDDASDNFNEMFEAKNPIYLMLLPFYTYLDLLLMAGYRPTLGRYISGITAELRPQLLAEIQQP